jgi:tRNA pseudouridine55 synthase
MTQNQKNDFFSCDKKVEGILLVNKDHRKTSFSIISTLRKVTGVKKIGHGGTLDPLAEGVMVIFIGKNYTTKSDTYLHEDKEYLAQITLGKITASYDAESPEEFYSDKVPSIQEIEEALGSFQGEILQTPPMFSAKKVNGKRLYKLARKGVTIERKPSKVFLKINLISYSYPHLEININCSKGTYIRSLANDLGIYLKTGGYLSKLKRTRSGSFHIDDCVNQNDLTTKDFNINQWLKK